jgi:hypothetical protein
MNINQNMQLECQVLIKVQHALFYQCLLSASLRNLLKSISSQAKRKYIYIYPPLQNEEGLKKNPLYNRNDKLNTCNEKENYAYLTGVSVRA